METDILRDYPELKPFVLSNVEFSQVKIGGGAYASVVEVTIPVCGAAKMIHGILHDSSIAHSDHYRSNPSTQFVKECQLMSTLRHPHIVQFLGVCLVRNSPLPALVMERMLTSLHDLLDPPPSNMYSPRPLSFFDIGLKSSVLHNVASGLAFLHGRSPPIIHRDLSAMNILLSYDLLAKIADLGMARIIPHLRGAATMTTAPGASTYMPPEAISPFVSNTEMSKYDSSIDIFSFGVVTLFTLGEKFPCNLLPPNYVQGGTLTARSELERRREYVQNVKSKLMVGSQFHMDHPFIQLIESCLQNDPLRRPTSTELQRWLNQARNGMRNEGSERNKQQLLQLLQNRPRVKVCILCGNYISLQ